MRGALFALDPAFQPVQNLERNPLFSAIGAWSENAGGPSGWSTSEGGYAYASRTVNGGVNFRGIGGTGPDTLPVEPGRTYTWSVEARPAVGRTVNLRMEWRNEANQTVSLVNGPATNPAGEWGRYSVTATAPAGGTRLVRWVQMPNAVAGEQIHARRSIVAEGTVAPAFGEGSFPGWRWTGTANQSVSAGYPVA